MIIHCYECGKAISNRLHNCPYCTKKFLSVAKPKKATFSFLRDAVISLRSLFF